MTEQIPAEYASVTKRSLVKRGGFTEWREVLCGDKVTGYTIRQIQDALRVAGYDPGPIDNILGVRTKAALTKFQKDKGLPVGNLDFETLKALGVKY
jgi:peptidoglycan hydrolase-like protein with peptidoglycan-binding domain